jgi:hypothetical protein
MHKTSAGEKRNDLQMIAQKLAQDDRALRKAPRAPAGRRVSQGEADEAAAESRGPQAPGPAGEKLGRNKRLFRLRGFAPSRENRT